MSRIAIAVLALVVTCFGVHCMLAPVSHRLFGGLKQLVGVGLVGYGGVIAIVAAMMQRGHSRALRE